MQLYIAIDDTDNHDSPGSGQLAEILCGELSQNALVHNCQPITRHQLHFSREIPYTSHNSAMCFSAICGETGLESLIGFIRSFLHQRCAAGSDPGLCVAEALSLQNNQLLIDYGLEAKHKVLSKNVAYDVASRCGVHLSENGGTGDGVIGALAGVGLRLQGSDGRFRGWRDVGKKGDLRDTWQLTALACADCIIDDNGTIVPTSTPIRLGNSRLKTVLLNHKRAIPVVHDEDITGPFLRTLNKGEHKAF